MVKWPVVKRHEWLVVNDAHGYWSNGQWPIETNGESEAAGRVQRVEVGREGGGEGEKRTK